MGALTNGLVQMNAKMVVTQDAMESMVIGLFSCIIFVGWIVFAVRRKKKLLAIVLAAFALSEAALFIHGVTVPMVKRFTPAPWGRWSWTGSRRCTTSCAWTARNLC